MDRLIRVAAFARDAQAFGGEAAARAAAEKDPRDFEAHFALGSALAARGDVAAALEIFLDIVSRNRKFKNDGARLAMLTLFETLGADDDLARDFRRRLQIVL